MEIELDQGEQIEPGDDGEELIVIEIPGQGPMQITRAQAEELEREQDDLLARRAAMLDSLGKDLATKRRDAINFRKQSGVEEEWQDSEDAYLGLDAVSTVRRSDLNTRPPGAITPRTEDDTRSRIVLNITKPYVNAFAAKIISMRLRLSGRAWKLKPTPIPEGPEQQAGKAMPTPQQSPQAQQTEQGNPTQVAAASVAKAQKWIDDRLVEGGYVKEMRHKVDDVARMGVGIIKGPFPSMKRVRKWRDGKVVQAQDLKPTSKRVSPWRIFPDPACGENIHDGDYVFEHDKITRKRLEDCRKQKYFIDDQIEAVLLEGPRRSDVEWLEEQKTTDNTTQKNKAFDLWYFTGVVRKEEAEAAGCTCDEGAESANVSITMVNEHIIRMALNPLDSGDFPYDVTVCSRVEGQWWGRGIAYDLRTPQRLVTGAARRWAENTGLSSGPQIVYMKGVVTPEDGSYDLVPNKLWTVEKTTTPQDLENLFRVYHIDSRQQELMALIQFFLKVAEDVTGMPSIMQGQQGSAPDVLGVVQILDSNSNAVASRVASMLDDNGNGPHVQRYYEWMLEDDELDPDMKGDAEVEVMPAPDVAVEAKFAETMLNMAKDPVYGQNPKKIAAVLLKANNWDPEQTAYTEQELQQIQENQNNQVDPRTAGAKITAEARLRAEQMKIEAAAQENDKDRQKEMALAYIDTQMSKEGIEASERDALMKAKTVLGGKAIEIRAQKEMQAGEHAHQVMTTPVEPAGRAPNGKAVTH